MNNAVNVRVPAVQAQRRSKEHSRSTSALSGVGDEKSEVSPEPDHHTSLYSNGFMASSIGKEPVGPVSEAADAPVRSVVSRLPAG